MDRRNPSIVTIVVKQVISNMTAFIRISVNPISDAFYAINLGILPSSAGGIRTRAACKGQQASPTISPENTCIVTIKPTVTVIRGTVGEITVEVMAHLYMIQQGLVSRMKGLVTIQPSRQIKLIAASG